MADVRLKCPRCGEDLLADREVLALIEVALTEVEHAKQRWPVGVTGDLRELARKMRCRTGTCVVRG